MLLFSIFLREGKGWFLLEDYIMILSFMVCLVIFCFYCCNRLRGIRISDILLWKIFCMEVLVEFFWCVD